LLAAVPAEGVTRRAFATSVQGQGKLSEWPDSGGAAGLAGGDAICRARAAAAALPNAATYRAWLSTSTTDAYCHVQGLSGKKGACTGGTGVAAGPWYLTNGTTPFAGALDDLTGAAAVIFRPVATDEFGSLLLEDGVYWTGTEIDGTASDRTCNGWTSDAADVQGSGGNALGSAVNWTDSGYNHCQPNYRLLCLEPGASEAHQPFWSPGALAFVTSKWGFGKLGDWPEAGDATGLEAGDAICRNLASSAHLPAPESFVAWLSTDAVQAADRVTTTGPYNRIDGFTVATSKTSLLAGTFAGTLHQDELGAYVAQTDVAWTGTLGAGTSSGLHCDNWEEGTSAANGTYGIVGFSRSDYWTDISDVSCTGWPRRLYCFSNVVTLFWDDFDATGDTSRWSADQK
jgi:hypothetical protein